MKKKKLKICCECLKERERCKPVSVDAEGDITYCCPACYKLYDYERFMYEDRG